MRPLRSPDRLILLQAWTMPLQGLANALVFSAWIRGNWHLKPSVRASIIGAHKAKPSSAEEIVMVEEALSAKGNPGAGTAASAANSAASASASASSEVCGHGAHGHGAGTSSSAGASGAPANCTSLLQVLQERGSLGGAAAKEEHASIFAVTWNVGEAMPPPEGELSAWLPKGRGVYMIGLQECLAPAAWKKALQAALLLPGTVGGYTLVVERMIGSTATGLGYHGFIVLFTFVSK